MEDKKVPNTPLQIQTVLILNLSNIQAEIRQNMLENDGSAHSKRLANYLDYLNRRQKLYQTILSSGQLNLLGQIMPFLDEYETKIQYLYFHKQVPSYITKMGLEDELEAATKDEPKEILSLQLEICKLEIVVQHLELILIQTRITDLLKITDVLSTVELQIKEQQQAYCNYIQKLSEVLCLTRIVHAQNKLKVSVKLDVTYLQNISKLFGLKLEEHFAWCNLQNVIKANSFSAKARDHFRNILEQYKAHHTRNYVSCDGMVADFVVDPVLLESIMQLNDELAGLNFPNIRDLIDLYAHSLVKFENKADVPLKSHIAERVDAMAHTIVTCNPEIPAHNKPREKITI